MVWGECVGILVLVKEFGVDVVGLVYEVIEKVKVEDFDLVLVDMVG